MTLYLDKPTVGNWPEPLESTWQLLGGDKASDLAPKLPHLGLSDILFLSTVLSIPRSRTTVGHRHLVVRSLSPCHAPGCMPWLNGCWLGCSLKPHRC